MPVTCACHAGVIIFRPQSVTMLRADAATDDSSLVALIASLSDTSRTARAQQQLLELIRAGGAATVLGLLLDRLLGSEGVKGAGARRAVAKILEEALSAAGVDGLSVLPKLVALAGRVLGDGESTVRVRGGAARELRDIRPE